MRYPDVKGFVVRPIQWDDAVAWASYAILPEVKEHTSSTASSVLDVQTLIQRFSTNETNSPIHFALIPVGATALVATVGFHTISAQNGTAEITYDVSPDLWGKGIATAACLAAVRWAFEAKAWNRIQATTLLGNLRSQNVLQRCGFKREGLLRSFRVVRGVPENYWIYSILPGEVPGEA